MEKIMEYNFFATVARMKYIERWALMRNTYPETLSEHSLEVSMLAHALCVIGNVRYGKHLDADKAAVIGLYHDASEIITGDMPTPIKYYNNRMKDLFHSIEDEACEKLIGQLPEDLQTYYRDYFFKQGDATEEQMVQELSKSYPEVKDFVQEFLPAYAKTLDELN